ncbi:DNA cytosine methyltransferase [Clostridium algidicarnis]|uniref:DNA cytosine methyltransferase n=1 Tax=Clostridium algidicarnis TaxID=37659 RepID=UPI00162A00D9|nr:DNA cytosine methyltransferase [Clostridium algidicarnis]MBB6629982.1 DNA cytosine methyltransferase [Clostridium algidicarnis]
MDKLIGLSLFSNIGVAEAYLDELQIEVAIANELEEKRARFYKYIYPNTEMIIGDITDEKIYKEIMQKSKEVGINFIIATPPCQGMSTAGKQDPNDKRNKLITYVIDAIKELKPKFVLLENVPQQLKTKISYNDKEILIPEYIKQELYNFYNINDKIVKCVEHKIPQSRERSIYLMVRKDINIQWNFPEPENKIVTLEDAIGYLPDIDPMIQEYKKDEKKLLEVFPNFYKKKAEGEKISKWHRPPVHKERHVTIMRYTPEGKSAFENEIYYPKKANGERISGHNNTYRRQLWDKPAYTITTYNGAICSYDNVHPGRYIGEDKNGYKIYSNPRVLTILELIIVMSLPIDWNIPEWADESLIRHSIGEGIPPLLIKKIFNELYKALNE